MEHSIHNEISTARWMTDISRFLKNAPCKYRRADGDMSDTSDRINNID